MPDGSQYAPPTGSVSNRPYCLGIGAPGVYPNNLNNGGPTTSITYVQCEPISSTLAVSAQFTIYAQVILISTFLFVRKIHKNGLSSLFKAETYTDLYENVNAGIEQAG